MLSKVYSNFNRTTTISYTKDYCLIQEAYNSNGHKKKWELLRKCLFKIVLNSSICKHHDYEYG